MIDRIVTFEASPVVIEELICGDNGKPLGLNDVLAENGMLHPAVSRHLKLAREIRIGVDGVFVKRFLLQRELELIAAAQEKS